MSFSSVIPAIDLQEPDYDEIARRYRAALLESTAQRKQEYLDSPEFGEAFDRIFNNPEKP